jgi:hypothetical protein
VHCNGHLSPQYLHCESAFVSSVMSNIEKQKTVIELMQNLSSLCAMQHIIFYYLGGERASACLLLFIYQVIVIIYAARAIIDC